MVSNRSIGSTGVVFSWVFVLTVVVASNAAAQVFGPPTVISPVGGFDNAVATDGTGNWVATWSSNDSLGGTIGTDQDILVARSSDNGATWTAAAALNSNAATDSVDDGLVEVATDASGTWVAIWGAPDPLGDPGDDEIFTARSTDNGATWSASARLNSNGASDLDGRDREAKIATDGAGAWVVVWESDDEQVAPPLGSSHFDTLWARSTDGGLSWSPAARLNPGVSVPSEWDPEIAADAAGTFTVVWRHGVTEIRTARSTDAGATWAPPAVVAVSGSAGSSSLGPHLATDGAGKWVVVWYSTDSLGGTIGADEDIFVARSTDGGATWTPAAALNVDAFDSQEDKDPRIATDGLGHWAVAWTRRFETTWLPMIARSGDDGVTWSPPALTGLLYDPRLATDDAGTWFAAWLSWIDGQHVFARSIDCQTDGDCGSATVCNVPVCDDADPGADPSGCVYGGVSDGTPCSDDDACTNEDACGGGVCVPGPPLSCPICEICVPDTGCTIGPRASCKGPSTVGHGGLRRLSQLLLKTKDPDTRDKLVWKWVGGGSPSSFGDPLNTTDFVACVYDDLATTPRLLLKGVAPAGGECAGRDCWKALRNNRGFIYKDRERTPDGLDVIRIRSVKVTGTMYRNRITVKGKGENLDMPPKLDVRPPVLVQLSADPNTSFCFEAEFELSDTRKNRSDLFKAIKLR